MALLLTLATGAWAQDPDPIDLTPSADRTVWTLSTMPEYDTELEVEYEPDYYLVGDMNSWAVDANYQLQPNTENEGEYYIQNVTLTSGQGIKVVSSTDGSTAGTWYPGGDNYSVTEDGIYSIYFRPDGQGGDGWYEGYFYVQKTGEATVSYYLVGDINEWKVDANYLLQVNTETDGEYYIHNVAMTNGQGIKVVSSIDGKNAKAWYPSGSGNNYVVSEDATYSIYFRPDGQGGDGWHYGVIFVQEAIVPTTTANKNEWTFTMPGYAVELEIEYETDLALSETTDNSAALTEWDGYEADVTLTRTLAAGSWNTFAAPFSTAIPAGWTVKELNTASIAGQVLTLNFADATTIEASKPYLVKVAAQTDLSQAAFAGAIVSKETQPFTSTDVDFIPTLGATTIPAGDTKAVLFLAANNTLLNPSALPANIKGFRGYFQLKGDAVGASRFALNIDEETTAVSDLKNNEQIINNYGYDLQGRRMEGQPTKKGVYIVNGKKVVIK